MCTINSCWKAHFLRCKQHVCSLDHLRLYGTVHKVLSFNDDVFDVMMIYLPLTFLWSDSYLVLLFHFIPPPSPCSFQSDFISQCDYNCRFFYNFFNHQNTRFCMALKEKMWMRANFVFSNVMPISFHSFSVVLS